MKTFAGLMSLALMLSGCAATAAVSTPTVPASPAGAAIVYDEQGNYALMHFSAGLPVPDAAEENASLVQKPTWVSFEAFEDVP